MLILGIESSCDETCAAVVKDGRTVLSNVVASQIETHALYGGVVPEIASRAHSEAIWGVVEKALSDAHVTLDEIGAIAVTSCPGLIGALLVGVSFAKSLAYASGLPLVPVHHIRSHIAAAYTVYNGEDGDSPLEPPFIALVASGGHTSLIRVNGYTSFEVIGATRDDAAGECFDKVARLLGFPYPGGAKLDRAAEGGNPHAFTFPDARVRDSVYDFSFSGLKTAAVNNIHNATQKGETLCTADFAASFTEAIVHSLSSRLEMLFNDEALCAPKKLVLAGGVAANGHLRSALGKMCAENGVRLYLPPKSLCGDNGVMVAAQGYYEYIDGIKRGADFHNLSLNACATKNVDDRVL